MKKSLNILNVVLLSCFILISSILEVHTHVANIESQVSESSKEIEDFSNSIIPQGLAFVPAIFILELPTSVILSEHRSQFQSNVPQLLCKLIRSD